MFINLSGCQQSTPRISKEPQHPAAKIKIFTTIAPLYCFTINIAGNIADVDNLLPSGVGPHEYAFRPADIQKIAHAQVLIKNGADLEGWLDKLIATAMESPATNSVGKLTVVDTSSGIPLINKDPHFWLSPKNAIIQVENIRAALIKTDPVNRKQYMENAENYIRTLNALDRAIREEISTWRKKEFVAFHPAFLYFNEEYGLRQVATIQETPEESPTPNHIAHVINTIKSSGIKAIFSEPQVTHRIVKTIAKDLNLRIYTLDTLETGALSPVRKKSSPDLSHGVYPEWYEDKMRENIAVLKKALN